MATAVAKIYWRVHYQRCTALESRAIAALVDLFERLQVAFALLTTFNYIQQCALRCPRQTASVSDAQNNEAEKTDGDAMLA